MVKVIMGLKGHGKTKQLLDLIRKAADEENGNVVCIEKDASLRYDIPMSVRLVKLSDYKLIGYAHLKGVICGLCAGNYDITHIFLDGLFKLVGSESLNEAEEFLNWCESFSRREGVKFTMTISADAELATEGMKKYF